MVSKQQQQQFNDNGGGTTSFMSGYASTAAGSHSTTTTTNGNNNNSFLRHLWNSMNPSVCLSPVGAATSPASQPKSTASFCMKPFFAADDHFTEEYHADGSSSVNYKVLVGPLVHDLKLPTSAGSSNNKKTTPSSKARTKALQKLFKLTDKESQHHRVPVVCTSQLNTIEALIPCLSPDDTVVTKADRRQALLLLNNLCIPHQNKKFMLMGDDRDALLTALLQLFYPPQQQQTAASNVPLDIPDGHIAAACLYNLSFLEEAKTMLFHFTPPPSLLENGRTRSAQSLYGIQPSSTDNPHCLLRVIENVVTHYTPLLSQAIQQEQSNASTATSAQLDPDDNSPVSWGCSAVAGGIGAVTTTHHNNSNPTALSSTMEAATVRWCMALIRNLATVDENAVIVATTTQFPRVAAQLVFQSPRDLAFWTRDSLEDSSLLLLLLLVQSGSESCQAMIATTAAATQEESGSNKKSKKKKNILWQMCEKVSKYPGIHGVRAGVILQRLEEVNQMTVPNKRSKDNAIPPTDPSTAATSSSFSSVNINASDPGTNRLHKTVADIHHGAMPLLVEEEHKHDPNQHPIEAGRGKYPSNRNNNNNEKENRMKKNQAHYYIKRHYNEDYEEDDDEDDCENDRNTMASF